MGKRTGQPRGRPRNAQNKITIERKQEIAAAAAVIAELMPESFQGDSHALLMSVYKDPNQSLPLRLDAAKAAIGYEKPKLAAVQHSGDKDNPLLMQVTEADEFRSRIARHVARASTLNGAGSAEH